MIIYLDVLFLVNVYITFFLLKGTGCVLHSGTKNIRILLASALGGLSSLFILLPELNFLIVTAIKAGLALVITMVAFGSKKECLFKSSLVFFLLSCGLAGGTMLIQTLLKPPNLHSNNGFTYIDVSAGILLISTILAYSLLRVMRIFLDKRDLDNKKFSIMIKKNDIAIEGSALSDTGNSLVDYFSGAPVIVCDAEFLNEVFPEIRQAEIMSGKYRLLPYSTINGEGLIPVIKADEIKICWNENEKIVNALLGVSASELKNSDYKAIFNPKLLN